MTFHMPSRLSRRSNLGFTKVLSRALRRRLVRKLLSAALIVNLFIWPGSVVALKQLPMLASTAFEVTGNYASLASVLIRWLFGGHDTERQETPEERISRVATVQLSPGKIVSYQTQTVTFTALGVDFAGRTIPGLSFTWESSNPDKVVIDEAGRATSIAPGLAIITCHAGAAVGTAPVLVRPGLRPRQTDAEWRTDQIASPAPGRRQAQVSCLISGISSRQRLTLKAAAMPGTTLDLMKYGVSRATLLERREIGQWSQLRLAPFFPKAVTSRSRYRSSDSVVAALAQV